MAQVLEELKMAHELPPLPYDYTALEPTIDEKTMHLHHDMHHAAYVKNLNAALDKHPELHKKSAEDLIRDLTHPRRHPGRRPQQWRRPREPHHVLEHHEAPRRRRSHRTHRRGNQEDLRRLQNLPGKFNTAGVGQFGSGWVWLAGDGKGEVKIISTPNQDSPISQGLHPIFGNDVWEHAYYLKYNNRRPEYLQSWWNVVNWEEINKRYQSSIKK